MTSREQTENVAEIRERIRSIATNAGLRDAPDPSLYEALSWMEEDSLELHLLSVQAAGVYDSLRRSARSACFQIEDKESRKSLIAACVSLELRQRKEMSEDLKKALEAARAARAFRQGPLLTACLVALCFVYLGSDALALPGAIGGATVGILFAIQYMLTEHNRRTQEADEAEREAKRLRAQIGNVTLWPRMFTYMEQETGDQDKEADADRASDTLHWAKFGRAPKISTV